MKQSLIYIIIFVLFNAYSFAQDSLLLENRISTDEKEALIYMAQEEKLARDVYRYFADIYDFPVFSNITQSEQRHMEAVRNLIKLYNLHDPVSGKNPGQFENEGLQALYDSLINDKNTIVNALQAGALIEETDIIDLRLRIAKVKNENIKIVFENLLNGSYNHIRAFSRNLQRQGITYRPVIMDPENYVAVINSENGKRGRGMGNCKNRFND